MKLSLQVETQIARKPACYQGSHAVGSPTPPRPHAPTLPSPHAFTLVELLLVMALMIAAMSIAAPVMAAFFRGRTLDSEARQMLSLTHAAQSRAVDEGVPMRFWVDTEQGQYGLEEEPGWNDQQADPKAVRFTLDKDLRIEVLQPLTNRPTSSRLAPSVSGLARTSTPNLPEIRFMPDGTCDEESPRGLRLYDRSGLSRWLVPAKNRLHYEIQSKSE